MGVIQNQNITYSSVEDLPIWNYQKIIEGDYRWLILGFEGYGNVDIPSNAEIVFKRIQKEYYKLTKSNKSIEYIELLEEISELELRYTEANAALTMLTYVEDKQIRKELIQELSHRRFLINPKNPFDKEFERLSRQLRSVRGKINRKRGELDKYQGDNDDQVSLFAQKVNIERILGVSIDLKKTVLAEWEELKKQAQNLVKQQQKAAKK